MSTVPHLSTFPAVRKPRGSFRIIGLSAMVGVLTGLLVVAFHGLVVSLQRAALGFAAERSVALPEHASLPRIAIALAVGAILTTLVSRLVERWQKRDPIDAVEANALRGGAMNWTDGIAVVLPILVSAGFGASVGIEAAVTQAGALVASLLGRYFRLRRSNMRLMVGAGAAAAIAAAYRAPIAGMLYSYELVLGSYTKLTLAPVGLAGISAVFTVWLIEGSGKPFEAVPNTGVAWTDYPLALLVGGVAAISGIALMLLVSGLERGLKTLFKEEVLRRLAAAMVLTLLSIRFPAVLGSGHAAIGRAASGRIAGPRALGLFGAKGLASAASLGGGFRGGLFSASLMMGALLGQALAWALNEAAGSHVANPELVALVGMAALAASIIGCPLAMVFLVLETTGDFDAALVVAIGSVTAAFLTDRMFGYSFATWRFQQRGLALEGGHDISRLNATSIAGIVRPPKRSLPRSATHDEVVRAVSVAGAKGAAAFAEDGSFMGLIDPVLVEAVEAEARLPVVAADLVYESTPAVTLQTPLAELLSLFKSSDRPTLAVLDPADSRKLVGCVRARDAFDLATSVLDTQRREDLGVMR
jgi:CIC family chloride channel protein